MLVKKSIGPLTAAFFGLVMVTTPAVTQEAENRFVLDLNNAADTDTGGCRLTYVAANQTGRALDAVSYQVAIFDDQGIVTDLLVLEFGSLIINKTKVVQFDLGGRQCQNISRITVNEVAACTLADGTKGDFCLTSLETSARGAIQFGI